MSICAIIEIDLGEWASSCILQLLDWVALDSLNTRITTLDREELVKMKKIALHTHLDGSLDQALAAEIAGHDVSQEMIGHGSDSLADYLSKFATPIELLQSWQSLRDAAYRLALALAADSVIYAEVRFCPLYHTRQGLYPYQVIQAVLEGLRAVPELKSNLILSMIRDFPRAKNEQIISLSKEALGLGVCAIDLAGD